MLWIRPDLHCNGAVACIPRQHAALHAAHVISFSFVEIGDVDCVQVYKGRWHSSDVAIKIINVRTPEELPKVLREAEVMMVLDHPNIVRAFHASVWNPAEQVSTGRVALAGLLRLILTGWDLCKC